jgi:hypothetical protein
MKAISLGSANEEEELAKKLINEIAEVNKQMLELKEYAVQKQS